ncbi:MAG: GNAT family N-acetyltransferase [Candidatus Omnitrophica bacterium]|nr:GNAT family N-acetyltransferase [Candidatus Omnitrophota bacterium]
METKILDPTTYSDWNNFIKDNFDPDIFHSAEWCRVLRAAYNFIPRYFLFINNTQPVAIFPLMELCSIITGQRAISLPFSDFCHPLTKSDSILELMKREIIDYGHNKHWRYVEFRSSHFSKNIAPYKLYYTHDIDLTTSLSELWAALKDNNKRNIKKAMRLGLKVRFEKNWQSLKEFYKLQVITRKRHGLPPQPFKFFTSIYKEILSRDLGIIASVYYKEKMIAASIFFNFNRKALFKYGASDHRYHQLRPNNLIMWEAINWHKSLECFTLNLGRSSPDDSGLLAYKRLWGVKESILYYYRFSFAKNNYVRSPADKIVPVTALLAFLPKSLLVFLGKYFYRHFS